MPKLCCLSPADEEDIPDLNVTIECENVCCITERNILQRKASSLFRRGKQTRGSERTAQETSTGLAEDTVDLHTTPAEDK